MTELEKDLPPIPSDVEQELAALPPVKMRTPRYQFTMIAAASVGFTALVVGLVSLRNNLGQVAPQFWFAVATAVLLGFTLPLYLAVVPPKGSMFPRQRLATAVAFGAAMVIVGLSLASVVWVGDIWAALANCQGCLRISALVSLVPVVLVCWMLRRSFIRVSRLFAASIGMSAGSLGFTATELHCANPEVWHILFTHVGMIAFAGLLGALIIPRSVEL